MALEKNAFGLDYCGNNKFVDYAAIAPYVDFHIPRIGNGVWIWKNVMKPNVAIDTTFSQHVQGAWDTNRMCGGYWAIDPMIDIDPKWHPGAPLTDRQIAPIWTACDAAVRAGSLQFIAIDSEIWQLYDKSVITNNQLTKATKTLISRLHDLWPNLKIGLYTGMWFLDQYAPSLSQWVDDMRKEPWFFTWLARYPIDPKDPTKPVKLNWPEWRTKHAPLLAEGKSFPWMANGKTNIWQYSGDLHVADGMWGEVKGAYSWLDLNVFGGTVEEMKVWCNYKSHGVTPPPVVVPPGKTVEERLTAIENRLIKLESVVY
jgi:hypothetical protein